MTPSQSNNTVSMSFDDRKAETDAEDWRRTGEERRDDRLERRYARL
jgi:hypothetical protein